MTHPLALGIDIGGTNTIYGLVNRRGEITARGSMPTKVHGTIDDYIAALKQQLHPVLSEAGYGNIQGVGVGAPNGNYYTGEIAFAPNLPWKGVIPLAQLVSDVLQLPCTITNDANAAATGEMIYGAAKGMNDFILVTLGTGVGSGFVANGKLIYGHDGFAGELGHVIAVRDGRPCGCGRKGCLEAYCSATGIVTTAREWLQQTTDNTMLRNTTLEDITARLIHEAALQGDDFAIKLFEYTGRILGQTLADMVAITTPQAIIFFGGLAQAGDILFPHIQHHMEANLLSIYKNKTAILPSGLPDADAAVLGASALVW